MPSKSTAQLNLTDLETRDVPAGVTFEENWLDSRNLTMSFAPDNTLIDGVKSTTERTLGGLLRIGKNWQTPMLQAIQQYVNVTNINVGLVQDSGEPFGISGEMQGDTRFGDIRIGSRPLSGNALATAVPFDWSVGTWSGDVIFNSKAALDLGTSSGRPDLYTVSLHEFGHIFGLAHADQPDSVMSEQFSTPRTGLAPSDIENVQARHGGPRLPDSYEGVSGNNSLATATVLQGQENVTIQADLNATDTVDFYRFTVASSKTDKVSIKLQTSGLSLLTANLQVLDSSGRVVVSDNSTNPTDGDLSVKLSGLKAGQVYTIRVASNTQTGFGTGRYQLGLQYRNETPNTQSFAQDRGANDSPNTAAELTTFSNNYGEGNRNRYEANAVIESKSDVDYYRITTPAVFTDANSTLMIQLRTLSSKQQLPKVELFTPEMQPVTAHLVTLEDDRLVLQVHDISRFHDLLIKVSGGTDATRGNYRLRAEFTTPLDADLQVLQRGTLSSGSPTTGGTLTVNTSGLYQFVLNSTTVSNLQSAQIKLELLGANGKVVASVTQVSGQQPANITAYLSAGTYSVRLTLITPKGTSANVTFWLDGGVFSDPMGPKPSNTSSTPIDTTLPPPDTTSPPPPPPTNGSSLGYVSLLKKISDTLLNPYGY